MGARPAHLRQEEDGALPDDMTNSAADESKSCGSEEELIRKNTSLGSVKEQLVAEQDRSRKQADEIHRMTSLVEQLETMVDRQVSVTESEHERIAMLEEAMDQQQTGTEEKVAKLILAVAGEKRRADMAEEERVELERKHQAVVEELQAARAMPSRISMDQPESWDNLNKQLLAERELRIQAEQHAVGLELQFTRLQQEVEKLTTEAVERQHAETGLLTNDDVLGENMDTEAIADVMGRFQSEMAKRMDAQNKLLQKGQQVRELQRQVDAVQNGFGGTRRSPRCDCDQECPAAHEAKKQRFELAEKEAQLRELQKQLADELTKRAQLQGQVEKNDQQLRDMQFMAEDTDLYRHQTTQAAQQLQASQQQVLQRTRELCDLQSQLTQELALRQNVQYKVIERERVICDLQRRLTNCTERSIGPVGLLARGVGDGCSDDDSEGGAPINEPEGEDATWQTAADSPNVQQFASAPINAQDHHILFGEQPSLMPAVQRSPMIMLRTPRASSPLTTMRVVTASRPI